MLHNAEIRNSRMHIDFHQDSLMVRESMSVLLQRVAPLPALAVVAVQRQDPRRHHVPSLVAFPRSSPVITTPSLVSWTSPPSRTEELCMSHRRARKNSHKAPTLKANSSKVNPIARHRRPVPQEPLLPRHHPRYLHLLELRLQQQHHRILLPSSIIPAGGLASCSVSAVSPLTIPMAIIDEAAFRCSHHMLTFLSSYCTTVFPLQMQIYFIEYV
ncbi:uncharacterized protein EDB91DRAFT_1167350 [Suillus paluster]|uniref:uncharacterized protein n=1 Tax=Suillus paluster TaxID=48578 RepID=UPI001B86E319|nr:uncharacterized protein EDB91DRAFT_1167350 [Suillus paluster]KAG1725807.1 hypothetical protein EDB91DRAFT_1167350 [Suillus paluster]